MSVAAPAPKATGSGMPGVPGKAPRTGIAGRWRILCWWLFRRIGGWRFEGDFPDVSRLVIIVAPHSSAWDGIWGLTAKVGLDLDIVFMGKKELFKGPLGWLLRRLGGLPVDRASPRGVAAQVAQQMNASTKMWFVLAPEGTRSRVDQWKAGFWKIARATDAPVLCVAFDYPRKTIVIGPLLRTTDSYDADLALIREWYRPFVGRHRGTG